MTIFVTEPFAAAVLHAFPAGVALEALWRRSRGWSSRWIDREPFRSPRNVALDLRAGDIRGLALTSRRRWSTARSGRACTFRAGPTAAEHSSALRDRREALPQADRHADHRRQDEPGTRQQLPANATREPPTLGA